MPKLDILATNKLPGPLHELIEAASMPGLGMAPACAATRQAIEEWLFAHNVANSFLSPPRLAGLWLLAGELGRSHEISQTLEDSTGSYWHGIMHRREGDYSNAKYWMRRVGAHPVLQQLASHLQKVVSDLETSQAETNSSLFELVDTKLKDPDRIAFHMVDLCELAVTKRHQLTSDLQLISWWEWQLLFQHA